MGDIFGRDDAPCEKQFSRKILRVRSIAWYYGIDSSINRIWTRSGCRGKGWECGTRQGRKVNEAKAHWGSKCQGSKEMMLLNYMVKRTVVIDMEKQGWLFLFLLISRILSFHRHKQAAKFNTRQKREKGGFRLNMRRVIAQLK